MTQLGDLAAEGRDYASAERYYNEALPLRQGLDLDKQLAEVYSGLGDVAPNKRQYDAAKGLYRKASAIFEWIGDLGGVVRISRALALNTFSVPDLDKADAQVRRLLQMDQNLPEGAREATMYQELGLSALKLRASSTQAKLPPLPGHENS